MTKSPDAFRTISEVADWLGVQAHVLRFWETKFSQVRPVKRAGGRRYYRPADMTLLGGIKVLLHDEGMTIKGVQKILRERGVASVAQLSQPLDGEDSPVAEIESAAADLLPIPPATPDIADIPASPPTTTDGIRTQTPVAGDGPTESAPIPADEDIGSADDSAARTDAEPDDSFEPATFARKPGQDHGDESPVDVGHAEGPTPVAAESAAESAQPDPAQVSDPLPAATVIAFADRLARPQPTPPASVPPTSVAPESPAGSTEPEAVTTPPAKAERPRPRMIDRPDPDPQASALPGLLAHLAEIDRLTPAQATAAVPLAAALRNWLKARHDSGAA